ncbi:MAG: hypothetical protein HZB50_02835 [Chloroflexi bacterium]|nr:hypothetical protein [Chloroflexota bacterium]
MKAIRNDTELRTDFMNILKSIKERDRKSLFLFLYLPWLTSVMASIYSTSRGYVSLFVLKNVEDTVLRVIFHPVSNKAAYIVLIALCNFLFDLILFSAYMIQKDKFEINKKKTVVLLLTGHLIGMQFYFFSLTNQNIQAIVYRLFGLFLTFSLYYVIARYLPKKYLEILSPYSVIFLSQEIQILLKKNNKPQDKRSVSASKKRLRLYVSALLLLLMKNNADKDAVVLLRKWETIDRQDGKEIVRAINDFCDYLYVLFSIQIRSVGLLPDKQSKSGLLRKIMLILDNLFSWTMYSVAISPNIMDLMDKSHFPVSSKGSEVALGHENKNIIKIIKYHLKRAGEADVISIKQKIYALLVVAFVYLISPTLIYIIGASGSSTPFLDYRFVLLSIQYFSIFIITQFSTNSIQKRYRKAGIDIFVSNRFFSYLLNCIVFLVFFVPSVVHDEILYKFISQILIKNFDLLIIGTVILQVLLLFAFIKPPVELKRSSIATSLLVRELLLLRAQVVEWQSIRNRRQLSRHVYFVKKYFTYIAKDLINSQFDSLSQKTHLMSYFRNINEHIEDLSSNIKLGAMQNRENSISQIDRLVYLGAIEEFGEIPNMIPEIKDYLELKSVQPKSPSFIRKIFQILDTSWLARALALIVITIIINLLNPSFWEHLQNLSSLFGILSP